MTMMSGKGKRRSRREGEEEATQEEEVEEEGGDGGVDETQADGAGRGNIRAQEAVEWTVTKWVPTAD